ncbi:hypothetical protein KAR91_45005 [Candidatus Pacearchaeota archaeon]|nr:hypothetical protein [Candidatus Pacearchaeota archaeon]
MIADNRKNRDKIRKRREVKPKPCWVQAYMIMLLHENAMLRQKITGKPQVAQITISLADLKRFEALEGDNKTILTFDKVKQAVTITAPEMILPEKPNLTLPKKKKIITTN